MADRPLITVICLCYNTGRYVLEALECVRRQTYQNIQLIIVDDGSTDGSDALLEAWIRTTGYPSTLLKNPANSGIPAVFNRALPFATGDYVTWIADDLWDDDRLEKVATLFESLPDNVGVVFGDANIIDAEGNATGSLSPCRTLEILGHPEARTLCGGQGEWTLLDRRLVHEALFWRCFLPAPAVTVRRHLYDVIGPYDPTLFIEDLDCWFRASQHFDFVYLRWPLVSYRIHATNFSSGISERYLDSLAGTLRRHRHAALLPSTRYAMRRHLREETYRVINRLARAGLHRKAARAFFRYYLPSLQLSSTALKETAKLLAVLLVPGVRRAE